MVWGEDPRARAGVGAEEQTECPERRKEGKLSTALCLCQGQGDGGPGGFDL